MTAVNNPPQFVGHHINTDFQMVNRYMKQGDKEGACNLRWLEKVDTSSHASIPIDTWYDVSTKPVLDDPRKSFHLPKGCPSQPVKYHDFDPPGFINIPPSLTGRFKLCIRIEVTDGCSGKKLVKTHWQLLVFKNGKVTGLKPPGKSIEMAQYCKYP